jgi:integrase
MKFEEKLEYLRSYSQDIIAFLNRKKKRRATYELYTHNLHKFFLWYGKPYQDFKTLDRISLENLLVDFQNEHVKLLSANSILSAQTAVQSFVNKQFGFTLNMRGDKLPQEMDFHSYQFKNDDLGRMFEVGNTKEKAVISLACSLGWESQDLLNLRKDDVKTLVNEARKENRQFITFETKRTKTNLPRLGVISPLALEWIERFLAENRKIRKDSKQEALFSLSKSGLTKMTSKLAKEAGVGNGKPIRFHKIRAWAFSNYLRGYDEYEAKYITGKKIQNSDAAYLQGLKEHIEEKYLEVYAKHMNIQHERIVQVVDESLTQQLRDKDQEVKDLKARVLTLERILTPQTVSQMDPNILKEEIRKIWKEVQQEEKR